MRRSIVATRHPAGSWSVCDPKLKNASLTVKEGLDRVNSMHGRASKGAEGVRKGGVLADLGFAIAQIWMFAPELNSGAVISVLEEWPCRLPMWE